MRLIADKVAELLDLLNDSSTEAGMMANPAHKRLVEALNGWSRGELLFALMALANLIKDSQHAPTQQHMLAALEEAERDYADYGGDDGGGDDAAA